MDEQDSPTVTILLLGEPSCGKSTFFSRLSLGRNGLTTPDLPIVRDLDQPFIYDIRMYNRPYHFEFYDPGLPGNWTLLNPDFVILCYDVSERASLEAVRCRWRKDVYRYFQPGEDKMPIMLLGLKRDMRGNGTGQGVVDPQEGYRVASEMRCDHYAECSAVTGELMREVFEDIAKVAAKTTTEAGGQSNASCVTM